MSLNYSLIHNSLIGNKNWQSVGQIGDCAGDGANDGCVGDAQIIGLGVAQKKAHLAGGKAAGGIVTERGFGLLGNGVEQGVGQSLARFGSPKLPPGNGFRARCYGRTGCDWRE